MRVNPNSLLPVLVGFTLNLGLYGVAQAALHDRGGGLLYDDVLDITWLQDANYAMTSGYDADGRMTWDQAQTWAANLSYGGYDDWRLPTLGPVNGTTFNNNYSTDGSTDSGYNITSSTSELAYMYYVNLGLTGLYNPDGSINPNWGIYGNGTYNGTDDAGFLDDVPVNFGENDVGLVENLQAFTYWYDQKTYTNDLQGPYEWFFYTDDGYQGSDGYDYNDFAWAVRPGDVAAVPEAETYAMMLAGLGLVGFMAKRRKQVEA